MGANGGQDCSAKEGFAVKGQTIEQELRYHQHQISKSIPQQFQMFRLISGQNSDLKLNKHTFFSRWLVV
jgi:hypothetical protein